MDSCADTNTALLIYGRLQPAWVNLRHDCPRWLKDGSFLWVSEGKDGPRLEHRGKDGALQAVLVPPEAGLQSARS